MLILRVGRASAHEDHDTGLSRRLGIYGEHVESGHDALGSMGFFDYNLILVDLHLPDMPGHEMIRLARVAGFSTPAIILAKRATSELRVMALDRGADDFITMPCDLEELLARARAVVRRSQTPVTSVSRLGPVEFNRIRRQIRVNGKQLLLTRHEFSVLDLLFQKQGESVSKQAFLNHLHNGLERPDEKSIDVIFCRLRKKLLEAGVPDLVDTVWGHGYILREPRASAETVAKARPAPSIRLVA